MSALRPRLESVRVREAVYEDSKLTLLAKDCDAMELHPAGVLVKLKKRRAIIVPFANIRYIGLESDEASPP